MDAQNRYASRSSERRYIFTFGQFTFVLPRQLAGRATGRTGCKTETFLPMLPRILRRLQVSKEVARFLAAEFPQITPIFTFVGCQVVRPREIGWSAPCSRERFRRSRNQWPSRHKPADIDSGLTQTVGVGSLVSQARAGKLLPTSSAGPPVGQTPSLQQQLPQLPCRLKTVQPFAVALYCTFE